MPRLRTYKYVLTCTSAIATVICTNENGEPILFTNPEKAREYGDTMQRIFKAYGMTIRVERAHKWRVEIAAALIGAR